MRLPLLISIFLAGAALPAIADWKAERDFRFQNGDRVEIGVFKGEKNSSVLMKKEVRLDESGQATLSNNKRAKLGFGNIKAAMAAIEEGYRTSEDFTGLDVEAQILGHNGTPIVTVLGEVGKPGHGPWKNGLTLADAIRSAGDFKKGAYKKRVLVQRAGILNTLDCRDDKVAAEFKLEAGDLVLIEFSPFRF